MKFKHLIASAIIAVPVLFAPPVHAGLFGLPNIPTNIPGLGNLGDLSKLAGLLGQDDMTALVGQITDYVGQINSGQIVKTALAGILNLPEYASLKQVIMSSLGDSGIPDPAKAQEALLTAIKAMPTKDTTIGVSNSINANGQISNSIARVVSQNILGTEGQTRLSQVLQTLSKTVGQISTLSASSNTSAQAAAGFTETSKNSANDSAQNASYSSTSQDVIKASATTAQTLTSTQDVLKQMASQNGESGSILSNISSQLSNASNQNYVSSSQLGGLSNQMSYASQQTAQSAILAGQSLQVQKQTLEAQAAILDSQNSTNNYLSQKQKELPLEVNGILSQRNSLAPSR